MLPAEAVDVARVGFIDCIATMIAGAGDPAPQWLRKALRPHRVSAGDPRRGRSARRLGSRHAGRLCVRRPDVQDLMRRVVIETNQNYDPEVSGASESDQIRVDLVAGGRVESEKVARAIGHPYRPLNQAELFDKLRGCLDAGSAKIAPDVLFERLNHLEDLSARELTKIER